MPRPRKIARLADAQLAPVPEVVAALETMLQRAKSGELRAVAIAGVTTGRGTSTGWDPGDMGIAHLWYAVRCLENRMTTVAD